MGSIPGPLIKFRFDVPSAQQAGRQITKTLQSQLTGVGKQSAAAFVADWQAAAAKLRASLSTEKLGLNAIGQAREKIIGLARQEISVLSKKDQLNKAELSHLKAATMEIERQKNALQGFGAVTSPTRKIVQQMISGIGMRAGSYGGGMGSFAGLRVNESIGKMADEATGGKLALLAFGGAAVVAGAAMLDMAKKGAELAVSMRNASEAAGISVKSMVELKSASAALGIDSDVTVKMFKKFNQELTYASGAGLPHASIEAKRAAEVFGLLGVNVKKAAMDPMEGFRELSKALSTLPEGAIKSATEVMLLGRGGQEAAPLINHLAEAIADTKESSDALASKIGGAALAGDKLATATANLSNEWHSLEVNLSTVFVPVLSGIADMVNGLFGGAKMAFSSPKTFLSDMFRYSMGLPMAIPSPTPLGGMNSVLDAASKKFGATATPDQLKTMQQLAGAETSDSTGSRRKMDFSQPLYLGKAIAEEWKKLQEEIKKSNEALKKHIDLMAKLSAETFAKNSFMTMMLGPIGIAADSPDKTGERIVEANRQAAQKIKDDQVQAMHQIIDAWKQWHDEGESLFQSLLSGGKNFSRQLVKDIESIALKPIQNIFGNIFGNLLQNLSKIIPSGTSTAGGKTATHGGVFGKIADTIRGLAAPPQGVQQAIQTIQNAQIAAQNVYINGAPITGLNLPKPTGNNFLSDMFGGGSGISSLSSLPGIGGMSLALAGAGGMAIAGSGGSPIATAGGVINSAASGGTLGSLQTAANNMAAHPLQTGVSGALLLGTGIATRNGPAMAMGIGQLAGAGLTQLSKMLPLQGGGLGTAPMPSQLSKVLGTFGKAAPGIGMMFAGNQMGGLGGAAMGAVGGLEAGAAIGSLFGPVGTGIGAGIGAIAGAIMGIFGKKNNQQAWNNAVTKAANNQRITQPLSENFAFAAMNTMASTFGTTFGQGPGGFSNSTLPANTPFWANAILGTPHGTSATIAWNQMMNGINPNSPFFGGTNTSPFNGGVLPNGLRLPGAPSGVYSRNAGYGGSGGGASNVQVHFTVPGYVDKAGLADIVNNAAPLIHQTVAQSVYKQSSGMRRATTRAVWLP